MELERAPDGNLYIHINIKKWTPGVYKKLIGEWFNLEEILRDSDEGAVYGILPQANEEFALMFGWTIIASRNGLSLVKKEII